MTERIERLKKSLNVEKYPICIEKFRIAVETLEQTHGEPSIIRRAKIFDNYLRTIPVFIEDDELFAGAGASRPFGLEVDYEYGTWTQDEIDGLKAEQYSITPEDEAELQSLNERFTDKNLVRAMGEIFEHHQRLWPFMKSGMILPPWKGKKVGSGGGYAQSGLGLGPGFFLIGVEYEQILNKGSLDIIADGERQLRNLRIFKPDSLEKAEFLRSVIIVHKAAIAYAGRYADLAERLAEAEANATRKAELRRIAAACARVPAYPAREFFEALQSFWFIFLMISPSPTSAAGRFDQYMHPFYRRDVDAGALSRDEAMELLRCLRIKDAKLNRVSGAQNRKKNAGMAKWHNWTIGGVDRDGRDASNELTYLLLDAAAELRIPHHTLTLRVHDGTPEDLMIKAMRTVKTGLGMPAFIGDQSYVEFFVKNGMPLEEARDYIVTGCLDGNLPGLSRSVAVSMFVVALAFDVFLHDGINPNNGERVGIETGDVRSIGSFEELMVRFYRQLDYLLGLAAEKMNIELAMQRELFPAPFRSSLMRDALDEGKDILSRTMPFENAAVLCTIGVANVADSLAAIKKLVFEESEATMEQLMEALDADWEGHEELRSSCLAVPKFGNDDDTVDSLAAELYAQIQETLGTLDTVYGGKVISTAISITSHQPGGALTGATPDGRGKGELLADGSMSPMRGMDLNGPIAVLKSASKVDQDSYQATLMNMKLHPSALRTETDLKKVASLVRTYFKLGGKHIQFNVVDRETLEAAQAEPEEHANLVVRVAGYSTYFTLLGKPMQDEIIERTEYMATSG